MSAEPRIVIHEGLEQVEFIETQTRIEMAHHRPHKPLRAMSVPKDLFLAGLERLLERRAKK
jgi:hypothetical protein